MTLPRVPWQVLPVFAASGAVMIWRVASWGPSQTPDAWAYTAWGQALARGQQPLYDQALTTPKPLGLAIGTLVSPLQPQRGFQIAVVVFLAALAAALFWAAFRVAGTVGAVVALGALGLSTVVSDALHSALIDGVAVALVMLALATRGRVRLGCLFLAGAARPEAWILCGIAAYAEAAGSRRRRLLVGAVATAAAPAVWVAVDFALSGDPLASLHRAHAIGGVTRGGQTASIASLPRLIASGMAKQLGLVVAVVGTVGLIVLVARDARRRALDPLLPAVPIVWAVGIAAQAHSVPFLARFLDPMAAPLLLGVAFAVGAPLAGRLRGRAAPAAVCAAAAFVVGAQAMGPPDSHYRELLRAMPAIDRELACGPLRISGKLTHRVIALRPGSMAPVLAAMTHHSLGSFVIAPAMGPHAGELVLGGGTTLPGWPRQTLSIGTLAVDAACARTSRA